MLIKSVSYKYTFAVNKEGKKRGARYLATGPMGQVTWLSLPASSLLWSALERHTGVLANHTKVSPGHEWAVPKQSSDNYPPHNAHISELHVHIACICALCARNTASRPGD